jgi:hypothetical protein
VSHPAREAVRSIPSIADAERCIDKVEHTFGPSLVRRTISFMNNLPDFQFSLNMTGRLSHFSVAPRRII